MFKDGELQTLHRYAFVKDSKLSNAYITAAQLTTHSLEWLQSVLDLPLDSSIELTLISGIVQGKLAQGKIICACKQVGINTITESIQDQGCQSIDSIKSCTGAGTGCGSCVAEVSNILADYLENNPHLVTAAITKNKVSNGVEKIEVEEFIV